MNGDQPTATPHPGQPTNVDELTQAWQPAGRRIAARILSQPSAELVDDRTGEVTRNPWHLARARRVKEPVVDRIAECGNRGHVRVECACKGVYTTTHCGSPFCLRCQAWRMQRLRRRLEAAMSRASARRPHASWRMVTLTQRHSASLAEDRDMLLLAWGRLRAWFHREWLYAPEFALRFELTPGTSGTGHLHLHVAVLCPKGRVPYKKLRAAWSRATGGRSRYVRVSERIVEDAARCARYMTKYLGKEAPPVSTELAVSFAESSYGRRSTTASERFWTDVPCPDCKCPWAAPDCGAWHRDAYAGLDDENAKEAQRLRKWVAIDYLRKPPGGANLLACLPSQPTELGN